MLCPVLDRHQKLIKKKNLKVLIPSSGSRSGPKQFTLLTPPPGRIWKISMSEQTGSCRMRDSIEPVYADQQVEEVRQPPKKAVDTGGTAPSWAAL